MENVTGDLPEVAVFQDDMLVSEQNTNDHLSNLRRLFSRLNDKEHWCCREKCLFALSSVEYLGQTLSADGSNVEAVMKMKPPMDVSIFLKFGSVQSKCFHYGRDILPFNQESKSLVVWS